MTHAALLVTVVLWAAAFPAIRAGLHGYSPGHLVLLRFACASAGMLVACAFVGRPRIQMRDVPAIVALGFVLACAYPLALSVGQQTVPAGTASILVNLSPIFTAGLAAALFGERLSRQAWMGVVVAFAGAALVAGADLRSLTAASGSVLVLLAALLQAVQFVMSKALVARYHPVALTACSIWAGTLFDLPLGTGLMTAIADAPAGATAAVVFLGLFPTCVATATWSYALERIPASAAAVFLYLVPPISVTVAWLWLGERPTSTDVVGGVIALAGVAIVKSAPHEALRSPATLHVHPQPNAAR